MNRQLRFIIIAIVIVLIAMLRFVLVDLSNFAPIAAAGIFGIYFFRKRMLGIPFAILALFLSDLVLQMTTGNGLYAARTFDYVGLGLGLLFAYFLLSRKQNVVRTLSSAALGSIVFFVISNFGVWFGSGLYPQNFGGLILSYEMGIPFYWGTLVGDLFFTSFFIGVFELLSRKLPFLQQHTA